MRLSTLVAPTHDHCTGTGTGGDTHSHPEHPAAVSLAGCAMSTHCMYRPDQAFYHRPHVSTYARVCSASQ